MRRQRMIVGLVVFGACCLGLAGLLLGVATSPAAGQAQAAAGAGAAPLATVTVTAGKPSEFAFTLSKSSNLPVGLVAFKVTNKGSVPHSFEVCNKGGTANSCTGVKTKVLKKGQSQTIM